MIRVNRPWRTSFERSAATARYEPARWSSNYRLCTVCANNQPRNTMHSPLWISIGQSFTPEQFTFQVLRSCFPDCSSLRPYVRDGCLAVFLTNSRQTKMFSYMYVMLYHAEKAWRQTKCMQKCNVCAILCPVLPLYTLGGGTGVST